MIKAIIFDNGGVIETDQEKQYYTFLSKKLGLSYRKTTEAVGSAEDKLEKGKITEKKAWQNILSKLRKKYNPKYIGMFRSTHKRFYGINKKNLELAIKLKKTGYIVPMLSNTIEQHIINSKQKGIYKNFKPAILSCRIGMRKPDKKIYLYTLKKIRMKPEECIFIDNRSWNLKQPKKLGIKTIQFKNYPQLIKELKKSGVKI